MKTQACLHDWGEYSAPRFVSDVRNLNFTQPFVSRGLVWKFYEIILKTLVDFEGLRIFFPVNVRPQISKSTQTHGFSTCVKNS